ncbi:MAG: hypothetical protein H7A24_07870 [Leptospiraceae bacterium]|nr:hypothetical protein [Leptospiraceae bacterium]MCP5511782.1 hypothetical protein [Leptospiraceae bacterium]
MNSHLLLKEYSDLLSDLSKLVEEDKFPVFKYSEERNPDSFYFKWESLPEVTETKTIEKKPRILTPGSRNITCRLCPDRSTGIRNFLSIGKLPYLVLHYTGEFRPSQPSFSKTRKDQIFRSFDSEDLFSRMVEKVFSLNWKDFFYQEFPGCNFNPDRSTLENWDKRMNSCLSQVKQTIEENEIRAVLITGGAAVLHYGREKAHSLTGVIQDLDLGGMQIPSMVIRSPDAVLSLEKKRKSLEKNKNTPEYKSAREEENRVKLEIVKYLQVFKDRFFL